MKNKCCIKILSILIAVAIIVNDITVFASMDSEKEAATEQNFENSSKEETDESYIEESYENLLLDMNVDEDENVAPNTGDANEQDSSEGSEIEEVLTEVESQQKELEKIFENSSKEETDESYIEENYENLLLDMNVDENENVAPNTEDANEQDSSESSEIEEVLTDIESQQEEREEIIDDPQAGREKGFLDDGFAGVQLFGSDGDYIHNEKFANYDIKNVIDVSKWQGDINWTKVKQAGIEYVIIRAGYRGYGESGQLKQDDNFVANIGGAIAAGIEVGVYFFSQAITKDEAIEEAETVLDFIDGYNVSLPVVIDYEYASTTDGLTGRLYNANLSKESATEICEQFCETVKNSGYTAMVYANKDMLEHGLKADELAEKYQIWLANYGTSTSYEGKYDFWQYTQSGTVDGISGNVDKSFWYVKRNIEYAEIEEGIYTISTCLDNNKVLDVPGAKVTNGINLQIYTSNNSWAQKFYIRPDGEDTYVIMSANSGKVLEASENNLYQKDYTGEDKQQWKFIENPDGSYTIESNVVNMVIDIAGGKRANGTKAQIYKSNASKAQCFNLAIDETTVQCIKNGIYVIESAVSEDKGINIKDDGELLELRMVTTRETQKFHVEYVGNGCYQMVSSISQKKLTSGTGKKVFLADETDGVDQRWILKKVSISEYAIISAKDGKNIDVAGGKTADGTSIQKYTGNGSKAQLFKFYETQLGEETLEEGIYVIHSALNDKKVLDVSGASKKCDANVQIYGANGSKAQQFAVRRLDNGNYIIYSYNSGMIVDAKDGKNANKTNVLQYFPIGRSSQEWKIVPQAKGYFSVISSVGEKALDVAGAKTANGTNVQIYTSNGSKAQKFRFERVGSIENFSISKKNITDGTYTICSSLNEGKVLDVAGGSLYLGANIQLYTSNNSSAQQFVIQKASESDFYTITSKKSGMQVTYKDGTLKNSVNVYQETDLKGKGQSWKIKHVMDDYYMIYASDSNFSLDISGGKTTNGANIQIYNSNGSKAQIFKLKKNSDQISVEQNLGNELKEGVYTIASALNNSMVLDVASGSVSDGANIQIYKSNDSKAQKYILKKLDNGNYTLTITCSDKLVSVNGRNVCQKSDNNLLTQQWNLINAGNGQWIIKSANDGKVMDIAGAKTTNGTNVQVYSSNFSTAQRFKFIPTSTNPEVKFISNGNNNYSITYTVYAKGNESSADNKYYLMLADSYTGKIYGTPLTSVAKNYDVSINLPISDRAKLKEIAMNKLVLAVKQSNGTYKAINSPVAILNPEAIAANTKAIFRASSKKGLQGVAYASNGSMPVDARYANTKQTLLNLDIADVVNPKSNYINFTYKGKTYKFSKCTDLVANIKSMNAGYQQYLYGNSGTTKVAVSLCLLLSYDSANSFLIDPSARSSGHRYYTLNVREEKGRETLEALFVYLGELFGQEDCYVTNWILGNEINSSKAWNYQGSLSFDNYMTCYATAFQMLYNAVKSEKTGNTVSISLDNGWNAVPDTYAGKKVLDSFAKKINTLNPNIKWSISYHPYSYPLTRADFWNDSSNTTNSTSTKYISMKNITVLTNYAASLEKTYKMDTGSIRVLLTEQGYSYGAGAEKQAQAIARGYYIAEFNNRIDAFIIRAIVDDAEEAKGKLYFGLMNSQQDKRIAFYVYEFMDSDLSKLKNTAASSVVTSPNHSKFNSAKNILCNTNWNSIVPGFNATKLTGIK